MLLQDMLGRSKGGPSSNESKLHQDLQFGMGEAFPPRCDGRSACIISPDLRALVSGCGMNEGGGGCSPKASNISTKPSLEEAGSRHVIHDFGLDIYRPLLPKQGDGVNGAQ